MSASASPSSESTSWPGRCRPSPSGGRRCANTVGDDSIPVLVDGGRSLHGDDDILEYLDRTYQEPPDAARHRVKARAEVPEFEEIASG